MADGDVVFMWFWESVKESCSWWELDMEESVEWRTSEGKVRTLDWVRKVKLKTKSHPYEELSLITTHQTSSTIPIHPTTSQRLLTPNKEPTKIGTNGNYPTLHCTRNEELPPLQRDRALETSATNDLIIQLNIPFTPRQRNMRLERCQWDFDTPNWDSVGTWALEWERVLLVFIWSKVVSWKWYSLICLCGSRR